MICLNSRKLISPSEFSSTSLMICSNTDSGKSEVDYKACLISDQEIVPESSVSNIQKADQIFFSLKRFFSDVHPTINSEKSRNPEWSKSRLLKMFSICSSLKSPKYFEQPSLTSSFDSFPSPFVSSSLKIRARFSFSFLVIN